MSIKRGGHTFERVDRPIRTPNHPSGKSHAVVIKKGDGYRLIRFGMQGAKQSRPEKANQTQIKQKEKVLKLDTQKILLKVKLAPRIGLTKRSGLDKIRKI